MQSNPLCITHNEPIQFFDTTIKALKASGLCRFCILQKMSNIRPLNNFENCSITFEVQQYCQNTTKILYQLIESMNSYQFSIQTILHNLQKQIHQQIEMMGNFQMELSLNLTIEERQNRINEKNQEIMTLINQQLKNLEEQSKTDQLFQQLQQLSNQVKKNEFINYKNFEYKLLEQFSKIEVENCSAIIFNQDASLIIYGCSKNIDICQFKNGCISNIQQELQGHTLEVFCLYYMKKTNQLISAVFDSSIIIWNRISNNQWIIGQKLNDHQQLVNCLEMNEYEDLLISGCNDKTIKFWQIQNNQWICTQTIQSWFEICGLSFDNQAQRLIACGYPFSGIWILESTCQEWKITQTIQTGKYGFRLCVIDSNTFAFQPNAKEYLEIYEFDNELKEFRKSYEVKVKGNNGSCILFPCQYIKSKEILIVNNNKYLNILRRQQNKQFVTQQSIEYKEMMQFGRVTDDGEYLLVWDKCTKKLQVRKLEQEN